MTKKEESHHVENNEVKFCGGAVQQKDKDVIALDVDGVLLDYAQGYAQVWAQTFNEPVALVNPTAYWPMERYGLRYLTGQDLKKFNSNFDNEFWSSLPALPGAVEAVKNLKEMGFKVVCVSALRECFANARLDNLKKHGFLIDDLIATGGMQEEHLSPKASVLSKINAKVFVDDYAPYFKGVDKQNGIHLALIDRQAENSPNKHHKQVLPIDSFHTDIVDFSRFWINRFKPMLKNKI